MREILFRGKMLVESKWTYGSLISEANVFDKRLVLTHIYDKDLIPILVDPETVGQYTGLKDKNGKNVFEHDIIKAYDPLDEIFFIGVVKYFDGSFYICDTEFCSDYRWMDYDVEVIGNVFDNPELLCEQEDIK